MLELLLYLYPKIRHDNQIMDVLQGNVFPSEVRIRTWALKRNAVYVCMYQTVLRLYVTMPELRGCFAM